MIKATIKTESAAEKDAILRYAYESSTSAVYVTNRQAVSSDIFFAQKTSNGVEIKSDALNSFADLQDYVPAHLHESMVA